MWPFLMKLGIAAVAGVGLGIIILLQQDAFRREIQYDINWRESVPPDRRNSSVVKRRSKSQKSKQKDEANQRQLLEDQLNSATAECVICTEYLSYDDKVWPCPHCWNIFHLGCISKWARASSMQHQWNCPVCRKVLHDDADSLSYKCMCGRMKAPRVIHGVTPHCCGQKCCRGCGNRCHPGPCSVLNDD